eukprot:768175-Prorocentrum_minimum.AAC.1
MREESIYPERESIQRGWEAYTRSGASAACSSLSRALAVASAARSASSAFFTPASSASAACARSASTWRTYPPTQAKRQIGARATRSSRASFGPA